MRVLCNRIFRNFIYCMFCVGVWFCITMSRMYYFIIGNLIGIGNICYIKHCITIYKLS